MMKFPFVILFPVPLRFGGEVVVDVT